MNTNGIPFHVHGYRSVAVREGTTIAIRRHDISPASDLPPLTVTVSHLVPIAPATSFSVSPAPRANTTASTSSTTDRTEGSPLSRKPLAPPRHISPSKSRRLVSTTHTRSPPPSTTSSSGRRLRRSATASCPCARPQASSARPSTRRRKPSLPAASRATPDSPQASSQTPQPVVFPPRQRTFPLHPVQRMKWKRPCCLRRGEVQ